MGIQIYINFNGNCREAIKFYTEAFGIEEPQVLLFGNMPSDENNPQSEEMKNLVMHTELNIKDSKIMLSDVPPGMPYVVGNNISLIISSKDMEEIKSFFNKLKVDGEVLMELQETFWSKCYGYVEDKFGIRWQLSYENS